MTCKEFEELSGAFALDAITPEERREAEAHLAECSACTRLYDELRAVVDLLPLSVTQVSPSEALKERVLAAVREEAKGKPAPLTRPRPPRKQAGWQRWGVPLLAAAAVLMFLLFGGTTAWNISLEHQIASIQTTQSANMPQITAVKGSGTNQSANGELIYYPQQNVTVLVMYNLPQLHGSHVYQGWLLRGTQPTSIGLLNNNNGTASLSFQGNATSQGYDAAAVSAEPGPTASAGAPRGQVVAVGSLKHASSTV